MSRDWNRNGKRDSYDMYMDYQLYKKTFGKDEDEYAAESNYTYVEESVYDEPVQLLSDEVLGIKEIAGKSTKSILKIMLARKEKMDKMFEQISIESKFRDVFDNTQMIKDFWLYQFCVILEEAVLDPMQKVQLLQLLLDAFEVNNKMSAQMHYHYLETDVRYRVYMDTCFETKRHDGLFWFTLGTMSGNEGERLPLTIDFTKDYMKMLVQLEYYLRKMFPGNGFGDDMPFYVSEQLKLISDIATGPREIVLEDVDTMVNPIFPVEYK